MTSSFIIAQRGASLPRTLSLFAVVFACALIVAFSFHIPGYLHHDTTEILMWAESGWWAGFWKHPPFLPWLVRTWTAIAPINGRSLLVLTAVNMTVAAWAVWRIADMARPSGAPPELGLVALLLLAALPFATGMAVKFNHNSGLISLWSLTTLAFLRVLDRPTVLRGVLFGAAAAAAVLAKYYSGLLLAACVVASFVDRERAARFYRSAAPYVAVAVFALLMAPHVIWLISHHASTLAYAFDRTGGDIPAVKYGIRMAVSFAIQAPAIALPMLAAAWLLRRSQHDSAPPPHRFEREIIVLAVVPYALTVILTALYNLRGATAWAMPLFICLPAVLTARVGEPSPNVWRKALTTAGVILLISLVVAQVSLRLAVRRGVDGLSEPRRDVARAATDVWHAATGRPLRIVGGDPRLSQAAVVYSPDHPLAIPGFDHVRAPWVSPQMLAREGGMALCRAQDSGCMSDATRIAGNNPLICHIKRQVRHIGAVGPAFAAVLIVIPPQGTPVPAGTACPPPEL